MDLPEPSWPAMAVTLACAKSRSIPERASAVPVPVAETRDGQGGPARRHRTNRAGRVRDLRRVLQGRRHRQRQAGARRTKLRAMSGGRIAMRSRPATSSKTSAGEPSATMQPPSSTTMRCANLASSLAACLAMRTVGPRARFPRRGWQNLGRSLGIELRGRPVEHRDPGSEPPRPRRWPAAAWAAREVRGVPLLLAIHAEGHRRCIHSGPSLFRWTGGVLEREGDLAPDGGGRDLAIGVLRRHADPAR